MEVSVSLVGVFHLSATDMIFAPDALQGGGSLPPRTLKCRTQLLVLRLKWLVFAPVFEGVNRGVYRFAYYFDKYLFLPEVRGCECILPDYARTVF
jgi:hypothetical protein